MPSEIHFGPCEQRKQKYFSVDSSLHKWTMKNFNLFPFLVHLDESEQLYQTTQSIMQVNVRLGQGQWSGMG